MVEQLRDERILTQGKTKIIWEMPVTDEVLVQAKDDITAGDGLKHDVIPGKAEWSTQTTVNIFNLLMAAGIPNHFVAPTGPDTFLAKRAEMIPIEVTARRIAHGSFTDRYPQMPEGTRFDNLLVEFFAKDDENHDPMMVFDFVKGKLQFFDAHQRFSGASLMGETPIEGSPFGVTAGQRLGMVHLATNTFKLLEAAWAAQDVALVDLKIECGFVRDGDDRQLVVADVIDNDSWRGWRQGDPRQMIDKQLYRDDWPLEWVAFMYQWVADRTDRFAELYK